jgi:hypothetical protein
VQAKPVLKNGRRREFATKGGRVHDLAEFFEFEFLNISDVWRVVSGKRPFCHHY